MRVASVTTNLTCNPICGFCASRAATDDSALFSAEAVSTRISEALDRGAQTIVLTGGEPTLHVQLPSFIRAVESAGQTALLLSNGLALADPVRLERLMQAGLRRRACDLRSNPRSQ